MANKIANDHDEIASSKNARYRTGYSKLVTMLVGLVLIMVVLTSMLLLVTFMPQSPRYYATSTNGQMFPMFSLSEPVVTDNFLRQWVSTVAGGIFTVSFNDWEKQLDTYQDNFTPLAWQDLLGAYNNGGFATNLVQNQLVSSAIVSKQPRILDRSIINGRYTWAVIVPVLVYYSSAGQSSSQTITLSLTISRVPVLSDPQGIQISHIHAKLQSEQTGVGDNG
jgi:intracellular multiplication protein IcmL